MNSSLNSLFVKVIVHVLEDLLTYLRTISGTGNLASKTCQVESHTTKKREIGAEGYSGYAFRKVT